MTPQRRTQHLRRPEAVPGTCATAIRLQTDGWALLVQQQPADVMLTANITWQRNDAKVQVTSAERLQPLPRRAHAISRARREGASFC